MMASKSFHFFKFKEMIAAAIFYSVVKITIAPFVEQKLVKPKSSQQVYLVKDNTKHPIETGDNFRSLGYVSTDVIKLPDNEVNSIPTGENMNPIGDFDDECLKLISGNINTLLYLSTHEGIFSHYLQVEMLWNTARQHNRTLLLAPFKGNDWYNGDLISMCDFFLFPPDIRCLDIDKYLKAKEICNCMIDIPTRVNKKDYWAASPALYDLNGMNYTITTDFDFNRGRCIATFVTIYDAHFNINPKRSKYIPFPEHRLKDEYAKFASMGRSILGCLENQTLIIAHYRRGWDKDLRCKKIKIDKGVNCDDSVDAFVTELKKTLDSNEFRLETRINSSTNNSTTTILDPLVYIATSEESLETLKILKNNSYLLLSDITTKLNTKLNLLHTFMIEVSMMCDANSVVILTGLSSIHYFIKTCAQGKVIHIENDAMTPFWKDWV